MPPEHFAQPILKAGHNCWRIETADRATVIIDAADYFRLARAAMCQAKHQIMLIGWDFDARIKLVHGDADADDAPATVGAFIDWLVARTPGLQVHLLRWDAGAIKSLFQPTTLVTLIRWWRHDRIHVKLDRMHPTGGSHHQKIVVIDDALAFCGGIDMTADRWDTREHRDVEPGRIEPNGDSYSPWHDATTALSGPVAGALGDLCRARWQRADGGTLAPPPPGDPIWPDALPVQFEQVNVAISRTVPEMDDQAPVHEIEQLYVDLIARAKRFIYAESQYFASRAVAEAIAARLIEPDGPEIVIINPVVSEGWLEPIAMDTARVRLVEALRRHDRHGRLRIFHPVTAGGAPIYVHAKVTVIDDQILRVGSSNFNNRSMRLDTECDVTIDATLHGNDSAPGAIAAIRDDLIAEHAGTTADHVRALIAETGSLIATIDRLTGQGRSLRPYVAPELSDIEEWLADNELLDPEGPDAMFEPLSKRGLLRRLRHKLRR